MYISMRAFKYDIYIDHKNGFIVPHKYIATLTQSLAFLPQQKWHFKWILRNFQEIC